MSFIKELHLGKIQPVEHTMKQTEEYKEARNSFCDLADALCERLSPADKELFEKVLEAHTRISSIEEEETFLLAFRLGAHMMYDCFLSE